MVSCSGLESSPASSRAVKAGLAEGARARCRCIGAGNSSLPALNSRDRAPKVGGDGAGLGLWHQARGRAPDPACHLGASCPGCVFSRSKSILAAGDSPPPVSSPARSAPAAVASATFRRRAIHGDADALGPVAVSEGDGGCAVAGAVYLRDPNAERTWASDRFIEFGRCVVLTSSKRFERA